MLERIKKAYEALTKTPAIGNKKIVTINRSAFDRESAEDLQKRLGDDYIVIGVEKEGDVSILVDPEVPVGDGEAVFLGEGTHDEFQKQEQEDKGFPTGMFGT